MSIGKLLKKEKRELDLITNLIEAGRKITDREPRKEYDTEKEFKEILKELKQGANRINKLINQT